MRILLLSHTNLPWTPHYARGLADRGHVVRVVSFHPDRLEGVDSVFLGVEPFDKYANKHVYLTRVPQVRRALSGFGPDVVFAPYLLSNGLMGSLTSGAPLVVSARGGDVQSHPDHPAWRRALQRTVLRWVCRRARFVHSVADHLTERLRELGVGEDRLTTFPVGVDRSRFHPAAGDAAATEVPVILCTRNHMPVYDIPTLIRACALLRDRGVSFRLRLAGSGDLLGASRALVDELGLADRADFLGLLPQEALAETLRGADVYVSPATSDGTSSSLLEALATGLLPVVTDIEANRPWVEDGVTGRLFPSGDAEALAGALEGALRDPALRARARERGPRTVGERADQPRNLDRLDALLGAAARGAALPQLGT